MRSVDQKIVDDFMRELDAIEKFAPMLGSYSRLDPEVIEHEQAGHRFRFVTFHQESRNWYPPGFQEWSLIRMDATNFVRDRDVVFDLGCNAGYLTTWFALRARHGHVHAFDPYPWNAAATHAQAKLNGLSNVTVHAVGIGPERKTIRAPVLSSMTVNVQVTGESPKVDLRIEPLAAFAGARPTFAKIDIEGAEHELGHSIVQSGVRRGYVEMHPPMIEAAGGSSALLLEQLLAANYAVASHGPGVRPWAMGAEVQPTGYYFERSSPKWWWPFRR
ncbi:FkbM family methyltransferase [Mesorhizobium sp. B3-1-3]|uniref:FkbM family methyltransferase n=1 Tax=unclassified Mesorhizobium TaxID=325217 RepID=UPI001127BE50|nr:MULTISPECIES: FkbM family methyltransferase [unclassified Mesorhizobium]TPI60398.1 FkbM family methyltransferase [Mesorhizobium sp. B3-1-8]TPI68884.1 FkbM family methyltransferase [Mesorhizobium sp. B3-1-3]UCI25333.1 FkbM family methyltransferase [Mesorhizobium sp. B2-8-5]